MTLIYVYQSFQILWGIYLSSANFGSNYQVFHANQDSDTVVYNKLISPITARYISFCQSRGTAIYHLEWSFMGVEVFHNMMVF